MKYLITGSKGFIGNNLKEAIFDRRENCFFFDEEDLKLKNWKLNLELLIKSSQIIFHVGAISSTNASDINKTFYLNYEFSKILFDLAAKYEKKVIYSSSCAIYGFGDEIPQNLYAWTKKAAEDYGTLRVKEFIALRYSNVYGPGEDHKGKMASVANQAYKSKHFTSNLSFKFPLFPLKPVRDFIYVKDVISANIYAATNFIKSGVYQVGSGESRTFEDVLNLMGIEYEYLSEEKIPHWYQFKTQTDQCNFLPGWKPEYNLEKGIKEYKKYLEEI